MIVKVDVVIPSRTTDAIIPLAKQTIDTLRLSESHIKFNVILVESGSEIVDVGQDMTIKYDRPDFSYNRALNLGAAASENDWIVFANNDLIFHERWMTAILITNEFNPYFGSFSPWNNMHNWHNRLFPNNRFNLLHGYRICHEIAGWCLVVKRSTLATIGPLSERCSLWYSDNIYADALLKHGISHGLVANSHVDHITSQTIDFSQYITETDRKLYEEGKNT